MILLISILYEYHKNGITVLFMSLIWLMVIYSISPLMLLLAYDKVASARFLGAKYDLNSIIPTLIVIIFILVYLVSAKTTINKRSYFITIRDKDGFKLGVWLWVIGITSLCYYIYSYGGLIYFISNMSQIRSGTAEIKNYFAAFIFGFAKYLNLAFLILFIQFLKKENINLKKIFFLLICLFSCLFSIYLSAGREDAISFIVSSFAAYYFVKRKIPIVSTMIVGVLAIFYIIFGKTFLFALNNANFDAQDFIQNQMADMISNSFYLVIYEFTHQYLSLINFLQNNYSYRFFGDYLYWLFKPFKLLGVDIPDSISYYNTYIIYGVWDSEIPPGAIAFGYISLGSIGVIIHALLLGKIIGTFDRFLNPKVQPNTIVLGFYCFMVSSLTYLISNSDPALFLQNRIPHILFLLFILIKYKPKLIPR